MTPLYDNWDKAAKRLMAALWRCPCAQLFHNPVDPDRLCIPDYFEVVKDPIDFGTIKQRLNYNFYFSMEDVVDDINKCFDNCLLYNGEESMVGQRCRVVMTEYQKLYDQLNIAFYCKKLPINSTLEELIQHAEQEQRILADDEVQPQYQ